MKLDKRRKYYMVLDCETATLPCVSAYNGKKRDTLALMKPLIYDIGWKIVDKNGNTYVNRNYLVTEIFSVPQIFDTAYYKEKRPLYLEKLSKGEIVLDCWNNIVQTLLDDMEQVESVGAYNASFDYLRAIPFTELYIKNLYSEQYHEWLKMQTKFCEWYDVDTCRGRGKYKDRDYENFVLRDMRVPMFDLWGLACRHLLANNDFRDTAEDYMWYSPSKRYYSTSAETAYRYLTGNAEFNEMHTALDDAEIETFIFAEIAKRTKGKWENGIEFFPFKIVGKRYE